MPYKYKYTCSVFIDQVKNSESKFYLNYLLINFNYDSTNNSSFRINYRTP